MLNSGPSRRYGGLDEIYKDIDSCFGWITCPCIYNAQRLSRDVDTITIATPLSSIYEECIFKSVVNPVRKLDMCISGD